MIFVTDDRAILRGLFDAAVEAANPVTAVARNLPSKPKGRTVVIAVGIGVYLKQQRTDGELKVGCKTCPASCKNSSGCCH